MWHVWETVEMNTGFWWGDLTERQKALGRHRHRWKDNNKMDLQEVGCAGTDRTDLVQDGERWQALVDVVINLWVP